MKNNRKKKMGLMFSPIFFIIETAVFRDEQGILSIKNGDNRTRTCDPLHVKQMLSQLSYVSIDDSIT